MAKAKKKKIVKGKQAAAKRKKRGKKKAGSKLFSVLGIIMALVFIPSTILLLIGMIPTFVAVFVDRSKKKNKAITVGGLNLSGCMPFLLELWQHGHSIEVSLNIISDPMAIVVMYSAAAIGYLIDWAMTGLVASILYDRGKKRTKDIKNKQAELIERWGKEVTGTIPLDEHGFAIKDPNETVSIKQASGNKQ